MPDYPPSLDEQLEKETNDLELRRLFQELIDSTVEQFPKDGDHLVISGSAANLVRTALNGRSVRIDCSIADWGGDPNVRVRDGKLIFEVRFAPKSAEHEVVKKKIAGEVPKLRSVAIETFMKGTRLRLWGTWEYKHKTPLTGKRCVLHVQRWKVVNWD